LKARFICFAITLVIILCLQPIFSSAQEQIENPVPGIDSVLWQRALGIHREAIVLDTHCDVPLRMLDTGFDVGKRYRKGHFDLVRMKEGGLDAEFFAVYLSNDDDNKNPSYKALKIIDAIYMGIGRHPDLAEMAFSPDDVRRLHKEGKRAIVMGMENGGPIEDKLYLLRDYYRLGVRYVTLTHMKNNKICDSSTDTTETWHGLSPFGKEVVQEMNRIGMLVDVSHISDKAFWDVMKITKAPVIASHSSCRALCDVPRNMSDEMLKALKENGGVIQINFYSGYLDEGFNKREEEVRRKLHPDLDSLQQLYRDHQEMLWQKYEELLAKYPNPAPGIEVLIDHIDHVVKLIGADHVGLGSDFDGTSSLPRGLEDVSKLPIITYHLLKRGYSETDIKKILGGNFLRVWEKNIQVARQLQSR